MSFNQDLRFWHKAWRRLIQQAQCPARLCDGQRLACCSHFQSVAATLASPVLLVTHQMYGSCQLPLLLGAAAWE